MKKCINGHWYDSAEFVLCPFCEPELAVQGVPDRFRVLGEFSYIGKGSISKVYRISGEHDYALKIIECGTNEDSFRYSMHEIEVMKKLQGKRHTVQLCDSTYTETDGHRTVYILEDYHVSFDEYLDQHTVTASDALKIMIGICDAISECGEEGVLHLDVQPNNIFIDSPDSVLLGDFSVSLFAEETKEPQFFRGTLSYMAPEVYRCGECSEQSDIYTAGIVLYKLFNKMKMPFRESANGETAVYMRLAGTPFHSCANEIPGLMKVIQTACAFEPEQRYSDAAAFKQALTELLDDESDDIVLFDQNNSPELAVKGQPVIYLIENSSEMKEETIQQISRTVNQSIQELKKVQVAISEELRISIMTYGGNAQWIVQDQKPEEIGALTFKAEGGSYLGAALNVLENKLAETGTAQNMRSPVIVFVSGGNSDDDYRGILSRLKSSEPAFQGAKKIGYIAGRASGYSLLHSLTGNESAIHLMEETAAVAEYIRTTDPSASKPVGLPVSTDNTVPSYFYDADPEASTCLLPGQLREPSEDTAQLRPRRPEIQSYNAPGDCQPAQAAQVFRRWCPKCGAQVSDSAVFCLVCGASLNSDTGSGGHRTEQPQCRTFCKRCGYEMDAGIRFCPHCGSTQDTGSLPYGVQPSFAAPSYSQSPSYSAMPLPNQSKPGFFSVFGRRPGKPGKRNVEISRVEFSAVAPKTLEKGEYSIISIAMYEKEYRSIVKELSDNIDGPSQEVKGGVAGVAMNSVIKAVLTSPDIEINDNVQQKEWFGEYLTFSFAVMVPEDFPKKQFLLNADIYANDVIAAKLTFTVKCSSFFQQKITISRKDILSAFVSYASQDRDKVTAIVMGMKKARPDLDIFYDIDSLVSGEDWEKALYREIDRRDVLYLCWSHYARESEWVDREWRYAYAKKGADGIEPVPMEDPNKCPPPDELGSKHFSDRLIYVMNAGIYTGRD